MNKQASTFVRAFVDLPPAEQSKVIDLIAEYYLANPRHRRAMLLSATTEDPRKEESSQASASPKTPAK